MYRTALEQLQKWKEKKRRKPLIIRGARQVGKTWLMKEFGKCAYEKTVYINFDSNDRMKKLFEESMEVERLVTGMELYAGYKIEPESTLLIFDEVQEVPKALSALKYFNEDAPQYQIICAGSLLGVALHQGTSFPVGKVEFLDLYPLSYFEFLTAMGKAEYVSLLRKGDFGIADAFRKDYVDLLKYYYFIGGRWYRHLWIAEISMKYGRFSSVFWQPMNRTFQSMLPMRLFPASECSGTVFRNNWQERIKNLFMD